MNKYIISISLILWISMSSHLFAQIGRLSTYDLLSLSPSARTTALSGANIGILDRDSAQPFANPALINPKMHHQLSFGHNFHLSDISYGHIGYGLPSIKTIDLFVGAQYINYGAFTKADRFGNRTGTFHVNESALYIGAAKQIDERLRLGLMIKSVHSQLESYSSFGLAADLGIHYQDTTKDASFAILIKNIGTQLTSYHAVDESPPFDLQIGYTKRLRHLPFRWMITAHHLHIWDLRSPLDDETTTFINQEPSGPSRLSKTIDNVFRHLYFGGELLLGAREGFQLRLGYSPMRAQELGVEGYRGFSGFNLGFGIQVKRFQFAYSVGRFHQAGGAHHLSLLLDLQRLFAKL